MAMTITTAATFPGTGSSADWISPNNICADDTNDAVDAIDAATNGHVIKAINFGFSLPYSTILGIQVEMYRKASLAGSINDLSVYLVLNGIVKGDNQSDAALVGEAYGSKTWGAADDTWGYAGITSSIVSDATFGLWYQARNNNLGVAVNILVDYVKMTVTYQRTYRPSIFIF